MFPGSAFDMDEVIILLVRRTVEQRNAICAEYKTKYEKDLVKGLESELAVEPLLIQALFENPADIVVQNLQKAMKVRENWFEIIAMFFAKTETTFSDRVLALMRSYWSMFCVERLTR